MLWRTFRTSTDQMVRRCRAQTAVAGHAESCHALFPAQRLSGSELEQVLCFDTAITRKSSDTEKKCRLPRHCRRKTTQNISSFR